MSCFKFDDVRSVLACIYIVVVFVQLQATRTHWWRNVLFVHVSAPGGAISEMLPFRSKCS